MRIGQLNIKLDEIVDTIMQSQEVVKLLYYTDSNESIYDKDDLTDEQKASLIDTKIFQQMRLPTNDDKAECYISLAYGIIDYMKQGRGKYIISPEFCVYVICHSSLCNTGNGQRNLALVDSINKQLHNAPKIGIGNVYCTGVEPLLMPSGFVGNLIRYKLSDWEQIQ